MVRRGPQYEKGGVEVAACQRRYGSAEAQLKDWLSILGPLFWPPFAGG